MHMTKHNVPYVMSQEEHFPQVVFFRNQIENPLIEDIWLYFSPYNCLVD